MRTWEGAATSPSPPIIDAASSQRYRSSCSGVRRGDVAHDGACISDPRAGDGGDDRHSDRAGGPGRHRRDTHGRHDTSCAHRVHCVCRLHRVLPRLDAHVDLHHDGVSPFDDLDLLSHNDRHTCNDRCACLFDDSGLHDHCDRARPVPHHRRGIDIPVGRRANHDLIEANGRNRPQHGRRTARRTRRHTVGSKGASQRSRVDRGPRRCLRTRP